MNGTNMGGGWSLDQLPGDAPLAVGYAIVVTGAILLGVVDGTLRILVAAPLLVFLPGYALLSVLFPGDRPAGEGRPATWRLPLTDGLGWFERCSLAIPTSIALLPLLALTLAAVGVPFSTASVAVTLTAFVTLASAAGVARRLRLPAGSHYDVPVDRWYSELKAAWLSTTERSPVDRLLGVTLFLVIVIAVSGMAVGLSAPADGESYTEVALLTDGPDGLVAGDYPETVARGDVVDLVVSIENHLGTSADYEVVIVLDRVRVSESRESLRVLERSELNRFTVSVEDGAQVRENVSLRPDLIGEDLRLSFFVYRGEAPSTPTEGSADHHLYLWLDSR